MHRGANTGCRVKLAACNHLLHTAIHTLTTNSKARAIRVNVYGKQRSSCKYSTNELINRSYKVNFICFKEMFMLFPSQNLLHLKSQNFPNKVCAQKWRKVHSCFSQMRELGGKADFQSEKFDATRLIWSSRAHFARYTASILKTAVHTQEHLQEKNSKWNYPTFVWNPARF